MLQREAMLFVVLSMVLFLINPAELIWMPSSPCALNTVNCLKSKSCVKDLYRCKCKPFGASSARNFCL
uniref:EGF-like domain-containing protein n=1 Tax=Octopus bimaculoides TaxID=37653 RepID=A0A0L8IDK4_OCTBM